MNHRSNRIAVMIALALALPAFAADLPKPARTGEGVMTFDTVPGWGLGADGKSVLGATHGGVVVDKEGNIYTSANKGVVVFSPDGKVVREFVGKDYTIIHDLKIRDEEGTEYIYGARNAPAAEGIKFNAKDGKIALRLPYPSYILYRTLAEIQGAAAEEVWFQPDWTLPEAFAAGVPDLRLVFLANPNSPSGTVLPPAWRTG